MKWLFYIHTCNKERIVIYTRRVLYVPEEVLQACKLFTKAVLSIEPLIKKVILFGSYSRGQQCSDSDIDIAIIVNTPGYFYRKKILPARPDHEHELFGIQIEGSNAVAKLRADIQDVTFPLKEKFSVHIITPSNADPFVDEVEKGIVLYRSFGIYSFIRFLTRLQTWFLLHVWWTRLKTIKKG